MKDSDFLNNYLVKAKDILKDKKKLEALLEKVLIKLNDLSKDKKSIQEFSEHISLFVRIIESYSSGKYTYVPWKSIALIVAGILYFIYPVDLIPDFIPISGIIDDVALIAWIYKSVDDDIQKFLEWEKSLKS